MMGRCLDNAPFSSIICVLSGLESRSMNVRLDVGTDEDEVGNADTGGGGGGNDGQNKLAYGNVARTLLAIQAFHIISARLSDGVIRLEFGLSTLVERIDDGGT